MRKWWKSFDGGFRRGTGLLVSIPAGAVVFFLISAAPARAADGLKDGEDVKAPVARSMVDAAEYLCRKECMREHRRSGKAGEKESPEFLECLKRCRDDNPKEITGTYALNGSSSSGDCHGFGPAIVNPGVPIEEADGTVTFFSNAEIDAPLNADGSFRGEGTYQSGDCTIREIIEGSFARDATGRIIFVGTRTFEDLTCGCTVSYRVIYTRQQKR
jgi:hypothetical protein